MATLKSASIDGRFLTKELLKYSASIDWALLTHVSSELLKAETYAQRVKHHMMDWSHCHSPERIVIHLNQVPLLSSVCKVVGETLKGN